MPEVIDVTLTTMAHGGSALGRTALPSSSGTARGQVVFVPYAIPGERVRVELVEEHARWARARLLEVLEPSPYRIEPPCPYFGPGKCGGCQFQHIAYEAQADFKQQVVADQLSRVGGFQNANVLDIIGAAEPWGYRNHVQFSVDSDGRLGFLADDSHRIVPVEDCLLLDPLLGNLWTALDMQWPQLSRLSLRCGSATGDMLAIFELDHYQDFDIGVDFPVSCVLLLADGEVVVLMGNPYFVEHVAGRDYRVSAGSFFQVNTGGAEALVALVQDALAPAGGEVLLDLYCGAGLFALSLAGQAARVIGIEADSSAAADFRFNARQLDHVELVEALAEEAVSRREDPVDLVVLDPPRSGAGREAMAGIARLAPRRIAYVSCDPATLARDARYLAKADYYLVEVQPVDMFPQTFHVESVALFAREP